MRKFHITLLAATGILATVNLQAELVLHWPFEEGSGTTTADLSGNGHNGNFVTITSSNWTDTDLAPVPTGTSHAIYKSSENGRVEVNDGYKGILGTQQRTISAWIKTTEAVGHMTHWGNNKTGEKFTFRVQKENGVVGAIRAEVNYGYIVGTQPVNDNQWHHVLAVLPPLDAPDAMDIRLYVDGELQGFSARRSAAINTTANDNMYAGASLSGGIDEVRVYDHAMNPVEINALAGVSDPYAETIVADEPDAWWRLGEQDGDRAVNEGNAMAVIDGVKRNFQTTDYYVPGLIANNSNRALRFDGNNTWISIPDHEVLNINTNGHQFKTVESWFQPAAFETNDTGRVIYEQGGTTSGFNQYIMLEETNYYYRCGTWHRISDDSFPRLFSQRYLVETGNIYHAVSVYDSNKKRLTAYMNGACISSKFNDLIGVIPYHHDNCAIGLSDGATRMEGVLDGGTNAFSGVIDEVAVYNTALSFERVQEHYIVGSGDKLGLRDGVTRGVLLNYDADNADGGSAYIRDSIDSRDNILGSTNQFDWEVTGVQHVAVNSHYVGITNAWRFDGSSTATTRTFKDIAGHVYQDSITLEMIFKPADLIGDKVLLESGGTSIGASMSLSASTLRWYVRDNNIISADACFDLNELSYWQRNSFIHVVGLIDIENDLIHLYVNGELRVTAEANGDLVEWSGGDHAGLGCLNGAAATPVALKNFSGDIALVRLYPTMLNDEQIQAHYQLMQPPVFDQGTLLMMR